MIRRLTFIIGLMPLAVYAAARWIATGKSGSDLLDRFAKWGDAL